MEENDMESLTTASDQSAANDQLPELPGGFQRIALSFSGGGFRASAFSLGCISYLFEIPYENGTLLDKVAFISSASGGSVTSLVLCSLLNQGTTFPAIYRHLKKQMSGTVIMDKVFEKLLDDQAWADRPEKGRNLINAFAMAYDELLFNHATFESLHKKEHDHAVPELCANTTEFNNGMNFRFGTGGVVGNTYLHFKSDSTSQDTVDKIKLGDILACSSCLPGGFEPVMFPGDFTYQGTTGLGETELNQAIQERNCYTNQETEDSLQNKKISFGFMDGGIDDNQGIYAFKTADDRKDGHYDAYFPCDVTSNFVDNPFTYPSLSSEPFLQQNLPQLQKKIVQKIKAYFLIAGVLTLIALILDCFASARPYGLLLTGIGLTSMLLPLTAGLIVRAWGTRLIKNNLPSSLGKGSWGAMLSKYGNKLLQLPLNRLVAMLVSRANSVIMLALTVFLKKIRRISYNYLYAAKANDVYQDLINKANAASVKEKIVPGALWNKHIGACTVYKLSTKNDFELKQIMLNLTLKAAQISPSDQQPLLSLLYPPSQALRDAADIAANMATTLWFDQEEVDNKSLESLIAIGQATMCFSLIVMVYQFGNKDQSWLDLKKKLLLDWEQFQLNPYHLI